MFWFEACVLGLCCITSISLKILGFLVVAVVLWDGDGEADMSRYNVNHSVFSNLKGNSEVSQSLNHLIWRRFHYEILQTAGICENILSCYLFLVFPARFICRDADTANIQEEKGLKKWQIQVINSLRCMVLECTITWLDRGCEDNNQFCLKRHFVCTESKVTSSNR